MGVGFVGATRRVGPTTLYNDILNLQGGEQLPVALLAAIIFPAFLFEDQDLLAFALAHDLGAHGGVGNQGLADLDGVAVGHQQDLVQNYFVAALARKALKHILRDPRSLWIIFMLPNVMMFLFGYAIDLDLKNVRLGVCDLSRTPQSRALVEAIDASTYFSVAARCEDPAETNRLFERRLIRAGVIIPRDFARTIERERRATVGLVIDGSDANSAAIVQNYLEAFIATRSAGGAHSIGTGASRRR